MFNVITTIGVVGVGTKGVRALNNAAGVAKSLRQMKTLLKNSDGVTVSGGRVHIDGVDKLSLRDLSDLYKQSVHNMDADQAALGKWRENSPESYERVAQDAGDAHFNLESWAGAKKTYNLTDTEMYELLNKPFLEGIVEQRLPVRFTIDPRDAGGFLQQEYEYLVEVGYRFDPPTLTMTPGK